MPNPVVSIVMPAFNVQGHLARSIESALQQSYQDWELIVIDDCSSDNTAAVVEDWVRRDDRVQLVRQDVNAGPSAARNRGFQLSRGEFITLLDADDAWAPERLARLLDVALSYNADLVVDNLLFFDEYASCITGTAFPPSERLTKFEFADVVESEHPDGDFRMGFLKPIFRTSFLRKNHIEYWTEIRLAEDFLLLCEVLLSGANAYLLAWPGYIYTTQVGTRSGIKSSGTRTEQRYWDRVRLAHRLQMSPNVVKRRAYVKLVKRYKYWMLLNWRISRITAIRQKSNLRALIYSVLNPRAAYRYIVSSKTFRSLR